MIKRFFPIRLDNEYTGNRLGLWLFGLVVVMKSVQSLTIIFGGQSVAKDADGIPIDTFSTVAADTIQAVLAQGSLWRFFFCIVCVIALVKYRSMIPLLFALFVSNYIFGEILFYLVPLTRVGSPPGPTVNGVLFAVMVVGLALSVWGYRNHGGEKQRPAA